MHQPIDWVKGPPEADCCEAACLVLSRPIHGALAFLAGAVVLGSGAGQGLDVLGAEVGCAERMIDFFGPTRVVVDVWM